MGLNSVRIYVFDHFEAAENARIQLLAAGLPSEGIQLDASAHQAGSLTGNFTNAHLDTKAGAVDLSRHATLGANQHAGQAADAQSRMGGIYQLRVTGVPDHRAAQVINIAVRCGGTDIGDLTPPDS